MIAFFFAFVLLQFGTKSAAIPEQVHLSFTEKLGIVVTWSTPDASSESVVQYGFDSHRLCKSAKGSQTLFVDSGPKKHSQYMHRVALENLAADTKYFYRCGHNNSWSEVYWFQTTPPNDASWSPEFLVFGDLGLKNAQSAKLLKQEAQSGRFDAVLHVGDFAYDMDTDNGKVGDDFMNAIQPVAGYLPYMTCPGNHEHKYNFSNYKARFNMPGPKDAMFYSFDIGPAHIISFSTEYYYYIWFGLRQIWAQYYWLKMDLQKAARPENRAKRPWIITMGHRPMYCSNDDNDDCTHYNRNLIRNGYPLVHWFGLEKLFYKYGVDLQLYAHEHSYERFWPIFDKKVYNGSKEHPYTNPKAPVHIISGSAGCSEGRDPFVKKAPFWSAFRSNDYGYARMVIHNATHLDFEQVSDEKDGKVIDRIVIIKDKHEPYQEVPMKEDPDENRVLKLLINNTSIV